mmetsp:Transcript_21800/g.49637  ORF Transcript_21800/g.49637 Transcript_21800/m.49637 type:complete len:80 (+) Transcript_21800:90-329(+)
MMFPPALDSVPTVGRSIRACEGAQHGTETCIWVAVDGFFTCTLHNFASFLSAASRFENLVARVCPSQNLDRDVLQLLAA